MVLKNPITSQGQSGNYGILDTDVRLAYQIPRWHWFHLSKKEKKKSKKYQRNINILNTKFSVDFKITTAAITFYTSRFMSCD